MIDSSSFRSIRRNSEDHNDGRAGGLRIRTLCSRGANHVHRTSYCQREPRRDQFHERSGHSHVHSANVTNPAPLFFANNVTTTVTVNSVTGTITDATALNMSQVAGQAGPGDTPLNRAILVVVAGAPLTSYALATSIGPVSGTSFLINVGQAYPTTLGSFIVNSVTSGTFAAVTGTGPAPGPPATPAPPTLVLTLAGLVAAGLYSMRRNFRTSLRM